MSDYANELVSKQVILSQWVSQSEREEDSAMHRMDNRETNGHIYKRKDFVKEIV